ncbi:hypothetical protein MD537_09580 [Flavihumibacter sediminis]|nr:hypothetical protein [Flavihumibacter sediminis]
MMTLLNIFLIRISVGIAEIIIFQLGAIALGFAIHFFLTSRSSTKQHTQHNAEKAAQQEADGWKLKYFNDTEEMEKRLLKLQHELKQARENEEFLSMEIDSIRQEREELLESQAELAAMPPPPPPAPSTAKEYLDQLQGTQETLFQQNEHVKNMLSQIEQLKSMEQKHLDLLRTNENLNRQLGEMRVQLLEKENEVRALRQQNRLGEEMQQRLEKVYSDYNGLLEKMQKLEAHVNATQKEGTNYAELQDAYFKVTKESDELKMKYLALLEEYQRNSRALAETEDKLRESNFQRTQLQKKATYLEELNQDLQQVAEHHNKLHSQMRRISEIEQLLAKATQITPSSDKEESGL